jgi:nitrogen fixation protein FixH
MTSPARSPWPFAIITWFVAFIAFLATFIVFAVRQREDLVRHDYYEAEVLYQQQLDRANRGQAVGREVAINYDVASQRVTIQLPRDQALLRPTGSINFYRPSDASLDHTTPLLPDANGVQHVNAAQLRSGLWRIRLYWTVKGQEFYFDQNIVIGPRQTARYPAGGIRMSTSFASSFFQAQVSRFRIQGSGFLASAWKLNDGNSRLGVLPI